MRLVPNSARMGSQVAGLPGQSFSRPKILSQRTLKFSSLFKQGNYGPVWSNDLAMFTQVVRGYAVSSLPIPSGLLVQCSRCCLGMTVPDGRDSAGLLSHEGWAGQPPH